MKNKSFIIKGDIIYSDTPEKLLAVKDGYLICKDGISGGVYKSLEEIPEIYRDCDLIDYSGKLVIPGLTDLHIHAPQYAYRGIWTDMELIDWLNFHTFPEESKYKDEDYAKRAYEIFVNDIKKTSTTRFCAFSTIHVNATEILMDVVEESGLKAYIGKVNMDRNSPDTLRESTEESYRNTLLWLEDTEKKGYKNVLPILTPRFIPSCTDELMTRLGEIIKDTGIALQSHLSENKGEIEWVGELCPDARFYGDAYDRFNCFGGEGNKTVMAHCVWSSDEEIGLMKKNGVFVAHSPSSNSNIASGIAPVRKFMEAGLNLGLATDVAGGTTLSVMRIMTDAIQVSKLYWRLVDDTKKPLTFPEAFYLATEGGGAFFGKAGSFREGFELDAVVLSEDNIPTVLSDLSLCERLERYVYISGEMPVEHKFVAGEMLF